VLGKTIGADLKEGKLTLPIIHTLENAGAKDRVWMEKMITGKNFTNNEFKKLIQLMHDTGGIRYCREIAENHIRDAKNIIASFPSSKTTETLLLIADYTLNRNA